MGMGVTLLQMVVPHSVRVFGIAPPEPFTGNLDAVASFPLRFAQFFGILQESLFIPVASLLGVLVTRVIFRRPWIANGVIVLLPLVVVTLGRAANDGLSTALYVSIVTYLAFTVLILFVLTRFGLFAMLVGINFSYWYSWVLTTNPSSWFFPGSVMTIAMFMAVAIYGFWISLGEQKVFKDAI
jgi:hypothetical protein